MKDNIQKWEAGYCLIPENIKGMPALSASRQFMTPKKVDCRDYMTPTEDQRMNPWCAAYAASSWAEAIMWQKNGWFDHIDPSWIYKRAKQHDGMAEAEGTTLTAVLEALRGKVFDETITKVKIISANRLSVKFALHQYGAILAGFQVTRPWYDISINNPMLDTDSIEWLGGHAIILCGYDKDCLYALNSWGSGYGRWGHFNISWRTFDKSFIYGAVLSGVFSDMDI